MKCTALLFGTVLMTGCSSIPVGTDPFGGEPVSFFAVAPDAPENWATAGVTGELPSGDWIAQFDDATMQALVSEALNANPGLEARAAIMRAAYAQARTEGANLKPQLTASASAGGVSNAFQIGGNTTRNTDPNYGLGLNASWEIDLWNRLGTGVEAAEAEALASELDLLGAQLSVASQTAIGWIQLNEALAQESVAVKTYEARQRVQNLTVRRFQNGLSTALDVRTARSAVAGAQASIAARRQFSKEATRRLEILLGRYPAAEIEAPAVLPSLPPIQPASSPIMLLARRPDIAAAEARIVSAGLRAEQARLAMRPSLSLSGSLNNSSDTLADVLDPALIAARLIANIAQPLLDGGRRDAQRDAAIARAESAVADYASITLRAWREVEDALAADTLLAQQEEAQTRALEEAVYAEDLAERQYANGLVSIFNLIDAQTRRLNAESQLISVRANRATNRVRYHLALGGGVPLPQSETAADTQTQDTASSGRS